VRLFIAVFLILATRAFASTQASFQEGLKAYRSEDYSRSAEAFRRALTPQPASGTLRNLGNAEWQLGAAGPAVLAWEQALWVDPYDSAAKGNLRFARKVAQLEAPDLAWYEVISTWLPVNWWPWIAGVSLWVTVGMTLVPGMLRRRKSSSQQALAAVGLMVFLLSLPALAGIQSRSRIGFVLQKDTPLRLTPTEHAQAITQLGAGEPARWVRVRGSFLFVETSRASGWLHKDELGLVCPRK
jgi:hypothetical protein